MDAENELFSNEPTMGQIPSGLLPSYDQPDQPSVPEPEGTKQESDDHKETIDQKPVVMRMEEEVRMAIPERPSALPTICEVPEELAEGNKGAYTPKAVCIGPIFDSQRTRASMVRLEKYKLCCVRKLIMAGSDCTPAPAAAASSVVGWSPEVHGRLLRRCFDSMMCLMPQIRAAYSYSSSSSNGAAGEENDTSKNGDEQLATKMLVDGCFVLHRLLKHNNNNGGIVDDDADDWTQRAGRRCWVWGTVTRDLLLLSNQVPFFVLRRLLDKLPKLSNVDIVKCGLQLVSPLHPPRLHSSPIKNAHHLLHLFYLSIDFPAEPQHRRPAGPAAAPTPRRRQEPDEELAILTGWVPCAKELEEAGVSFCARTSKHAAGTDAAVSSFLDIKFRAGRGILRGGILEIPPLQLFDYSEPMFRNLIAFEQTFPDTPGRVTAYAIFMDCLIKTAEDARLLHASGVLVSHMNGDRGGDAAMGFFSRLCAEVHTSSDRNYLAGVMEEVYRYQKRRCSRWRADLVRNYFTNPWVIMSVLAAFVLLVLTVLQTVYTVYPYYKPGAS